MLIESFNQLIVTIGIPSLAGGMLYVARELVRIGKRLQILDDLKSSVDHEIRPGLKDVRERFLIVEDRMETVWKDKLAPARSPRQLNERGGDILEKSGIKELLDEKRGDLLEEIRKGAPSNAYDAERHIERFMLSEFPKMFPKEVEALKDGAFRTGADLDAVLFVGSIYLRDGIFRDLGFDASDLDKH
jgi:hypothetical protein